MKKIIIGTLLASIAILVLVGTTTQAATRKEKKIQTLEKKLERLRATPSPSASATPRPTPTARPTPKPFDNTCIKNTVNKRETAVASSYETYSTAIKNALATRKTDLNSAWDKTETKDQRQGITSAWKKYREARNAARNTLKKATNSAWDTFVKENRACRKSGNVHEDYVNRVEDSLI